ncbi:MAG TPA: right-handed parallel beta-helix repeat-containing protein [Polyangiaceae bacterium]|nr:right-handed parallel beta-helix repeat-containing protein [Polyangiaceae bacterium]
MKSRTIGVRTVSALGVLFSVAAYAPDAAASIRVNTTSMWIEDAPRCRIDEALAAIESGTSVDGCVYDGTNVITLGPFLTDSGTVQNNGDIWVQEGLHLDNVVVEGHAAGTVRLVTDGFMAPYAVWMANEATLRNVQVVALNILPGKSVTGVYVASDGLAALERVRVIGFNDGGIYMDGTFLSMFRSSISNNRAVRGGGLYINSGQCVAKYSTFANNKATGGSGGGIYVQPPAGGYAELNGFHLTVAGNTATGVGAGIYIGPGAGTSTSLNGSLVAENTRAGTATRDDYRGRMRPLSTNPAFYAAHWQVGLNRNLLTSGTASNMPGYKASYTDESPSATCPSTICTGRHFASWDRVVSDAGIGARASDGTVTLGSDGTVALQSGSLAINGGIQSATVGSSTGWYWDRQNFTTDQRGVAAPRGASHDQGAFER